MTTEEKKIKIIAAVTTVLLATAIIYLTVEMRANGKLEESLNTERLKSESMLSEKLSLEKEIVKFKNQLKSFQGKNEELDKILNSTYKKLDAKDAELKNSQQQIHSLSKIKRQHEDLVRIKAELEQQLAQYNTSLKQLQEEKENLSQRVAILQQRNQNLMDELNAIQLASINDARIESTKKNDKLTVRARKTKKLLINVDVPSDVKDLKFKIIDPSGKELTENDGTIAYKVVNETAKSATFASLHNIVLESNSYKEVEMVYTPTQKLVPGIYKIDISNNNSSIGSLQVRFK